MPTIDWVAFFVAGWGLPFSLYVAAQVSALIVLKGQMKWAALLPVLPMLWVAYATADALRAESNLWPLLLILAPPVAIGYLLLVGLASRNRTRTRV